MGLTKDELRANHYVPELVPDSDLVYFETDRSSRSIGWGQSPAVLVVDMTLAFTEERPEVGEPCIEANVELIEAARRVEAPVFFSAPYPAGTFPEDYHGVTKGGSGQLASEPSETRRKWKENLDVIAPGLEPRDDEVVVEKPRASSFFDTHVSNLLHYYGIDTLVVSGMTTSGCVRATVVDGHSSNFRVIVPIECVADRSVISHEISLFDMDMKYADVTPLDRVVERLESVV